MRVEYGVIDALTKAGVYDDVPMRRIFLMSPHDPLIQELQKEAKTRNEGFIHILRLKPLLAGVIRRQGRPPKIIHLIDQHYQNLRVELYKAFDTLGLAIA